MERRNTLDKYKPSRGLVISPLVLCIDRKLGVRVFSSPEQQREVFPSKSLAMHSRVALLVLGNKREVKLTRNCF